MATPIPAAGNGQEKAVVLYKGDAEAVHPLARYGESRVVRIVADRLMLTDNRKNALTRDEALLTAQCAIACQLNPFPPNPELWAWVTVRQDGRRDLTLMRGRDGTVKIAMKNSKAQGSYLLAPRFRLITDAAERERLHIPEGALAFYCTSEDYLSITTWQSMVTTMKDAGVSADKLLEKAGDPPCDWGIGYVTAEEMENLEYWHDRNGKRGRKLEVKMTHVERAQKRAYMAALRKRWAAYEEPEQVASSLDTDAYIVEGEWMEAPIPAEHASETREDLKAAAEDAAETLYGDQGEPASKPSTPVKSPSPAKPATPEAPPPAERMFDNALIEELAKEGLAPTKAEAAAMLGHSPWRYKATPMKKATLKAWCRGYNRGIDEGLEPDAAASAASEEIKELEGTGG
jgi:hypothetical protein